MSTVAKVIEITASSNKSFEDAITAGIAQAGKTVKGIKGAWVSEQKVVVDKNKVVEWRVTMKVSFVIE